MSETTKKLQEKETQNYIFGSFSKIEISDDYFSKIDKIFSILDEKSFFKGDNIEEYKKLSKLKKFLKNEIKNEDSINGVESSNNSLVIYLKDGSQLKINYKDFEKFLLKDILKGEKKVDIEKKVSNLNNAIEAIYEDNQGIIFDGEIDNEDIITDDLIEEYNLDKNLKNKNLKELKKLLELENDKLFKVYDITGEAHKKQELLKKEIIFFAGIGDKYEGITSYIGMTTVEANEKVEELGAVMSIEELFNYIIFLNKEISDNYKKAAIVEQVNLKLISAFYSYSFERLKKENADNKKYIQLIKIITGRGKLKNSDNGNYNEKQEFSYKSLDIDDKFRDSLLANKILIYLMYKKGGLMEKIEQKKKIKIEDEEMKGKTPSLVIAESKKLFGKIGNKGETVLEKLGYKNLLNINKPYKELSFQEKINIGSLARLNSKLANSKYKTIADIKSIAGEVANDTLEELNDSLSDNFDAFSDGILDLDGAEASDFGLTGEKAEIFELYQDINGNGLFDLSDENELGVGTLIIGLTLVASIVIIGPLFVGGVGALTVGNVLQAVTLLTISETSIELLLSREGYASNEEMFEHIVSKLGINFAINLVFLGGFFAVFKKGIIKFLEKKGLTRIVKGIKDWKNLNQSQKNHILRGLEKSGVWNPDLIFSKKAWTTKAGAVDKSFIAAEGLTSKKVNGKYETYRREKHKENYTNTDLKNKLDK